jgi:hypothetical protein
MLKQRKPASHFANNPHCETNINYQSDTPEIFKKNAVRLKPLQGFSLKGVHK